MPATSLSAQGGGDICQKCTTRREGRRGRFVLGLVGLSGLLLVAAVAASPQINLGNSVLALSDLNGDGVLEIAAGAPYSPTRWSEESPAWGGSGAVLVLCGATRDLLQVWRGDAGQVRFGSAMCSHSDLDGDGVRDVRIGYQVGDWVKRGECDVRSGVDGSLIRTFSAPFTRVHEVGDVDGDDVSDVMVFGGSGWRLRSGATHDVLATADRPVPDGKVWPLGDVDGDGALDFLATGVWSEWLISGLDDPPPSGSWFARGVDAGIAARWRPYGRRARVPLKQACRADVSAFRLQEASAFDGAEESKLVPPLDARAVTSSKRLGYSVVPIGDIDGDSTGDLVALIGGSIVAQSGVRRAELWEAPYVLDHFSAEISLALYGDVDRDGISEILVGGRSSFGSQQYGHHGTVRLISGSTGAEVWSFDEWGDAWERIRAL